MQTPAAFEERRTSAGRLLALRILFVLAFSVLAVSFWMIQVVQNARYEERAVRNHMRAIPLLAPRGVIFDREERVLVENQPSFTIAVIREQVQDLERTVKRIAELTGVEPSAMRVVIDRRRLEPEFRPLPLIEHATLRQAAAIAARQEELPGVVVQQVPSRKYPEGLAAHLFGYVGEIQEGQLESAEYAHLDAGAIIGQDGLERVYNARLMGDDGNRYVTINSFGRELDELRQQSPIDGERLQLTLDLDLQRALEEAFHGLGFNGAAVFLEPRTGEVLAMASLPAYDPNQFVSGFDLETWTALNADPDNPLMNRLIRGTYHPGSTFKIVMALAALEEGVITPETEYYCPGHFTFGGRTYACHRAGGHGSVDLREALEQSCNVYFYNVGSRLSIDTIHQYAERLGLTGRTGIDLPGEVQSLVPSTAWKQETFQEPWYPGETISVAIGQGAVSVTPMALATMMATVANGGTLVTPHLARAFDAGDGRGWEPVPTPEPRSRLFIQPEHLRAVREGLWQVVNANGTGGRARIEGHDVAGKTGTAQVVALRNQGVEGVETRDHGWFVFFAPHDDPQIAGVVFGEHAEHGSWVAPIAKHVLETYFAKKEGRPLPVFPEAAP